MKQQTKLNLDTIVDEFEITVPEVAKINRDLKKVIVNSGKVSKEEIRTIVKLFYQVQDIRIALTEQHRSLVKNQKEKLKKNPTATSDSSFIVIEFLLSQIVIIENDIKTCLETLLKQDEVGKWLLSIKGIGPSLAASVIAYFDVEGRQYASQFISYAGLNDQNRPWLGKEKATEIVNNIVGKSKEVTDDMVMQIAAATQWKYETLRNNAYNEDKESWSKTKLIAACAKIPYNKDVKTLMFNIGSSFIYQKNRPDSLYGKLFAERKVQEIANNEKGKFADQAKAKLEKYNIGKNTEAYKYYSNGQLPPAQLNMRAMRFANKVFLSHVFEEMYRVRYDELPPRYYPLEHLEGQHNKNIAPEVPFTKVSGEK